MSKEEKQIWIATYAAGFVYAATNHAKGPDAHLAEYGICFANSAIRGLRKWREDENINAGVTVSE